MTREDHQPKEGAVERKRHQTGELTSACNRTVAVVLALEESTTPLVVQFEEPDREPITCLPDPGKPPVMRPMQVYEGKPAVSWVVEAARKAQMSEVFVLTTPAMSDAVMGALFGPKRRGIGSHVQIIEVDAPALLGRTRDAANFTMFDVPFSILEIARGLAGTEPDGYDNVLIVTADAVRITTEHIYEICLEAQKNPDADVVASWISWLRRPPYLFSREFLEGLEERGLTKPGANGRDRDVPRISVIDHVFGEEKLAPSSVARRSLEQFAAAQPCAALQAVNLAERSMADPATKLVSPNRSTSSTAEVGEKPLTAGEKLLVSVARDVLSAPCDAELAQELDWADAFGKRCRLDFPLLTDREHADVLAYLDTAATSQRVDVALRAQSDFDAHANANVYRGGYELSTNSTAAYNEARARIESFIGAGRREVVFTANTTTATNLVSTAWGEWNIGEDDVIVTTLSAHHSNMLPFLMLAERKGAQVLHIPYGPDGRLDQEAYSKLLERNPKLVCVEHVGNVFGIVEPVRAMADAAHKAGARFLLDAAQSFGRVKLDVNELGADWVAFSGHKAYGPMGIGALWISPKVFDEMDPLGGGGGAVSHVGEQSYYLRPKALQYEMGTPPVSQAIGWAAAVGYLEAIGMDNIARHDAALTRYAVEGLHRIDGVDIMGDHSKPDGKSGLVSFTLRSVTPAELAKFAGKLGVAMRAGGHCALPLHAHMGLIGTGRISLGVYTTKADIDAALVAIETCRRAYER